MLRVQPWLARRDASCCVCGGALLHDYGVADAACAFIGLEDASSAFNACKHVTHVQHGLCRVGGEKQSSNRASIERMGRTGSRTALGRLAFTHSRGVRIPSRCTARQHPDPPCIRCISWQYDGAGTQQHAVAAISLLITNRGRGS